MIAHYLLHQTQADFLQADLNCRALHSLWKSCLELGGASHGTTTVQDCLCIYEAPLVYSPDISTSMSQCLSCFSPLSPAYSNVTYLEGCAADDFCANRGVDTDAAEFSATASQIAEENDFPLILPDAIYIGNTADLETPTKAARDVNSTGVAAEVACLGKFTFACFCERKLANLQSPLRHS